MEKTAREWLMELKPEHRDLAIENVEKIKINSGGFLNHKRKSLKDALLSSFIWIHSIEGYEYWLEIYHKLESNTYYDEEAKS
jgi:hypothetical protein